MIWASAALLVFLIIGTRWADRRFRRKVARDWESTREAREAFRDEVDGPCGHDWHESEGRWAGGPVRCPACNERQDGALPWIPSSAKYGGTTHSATVHIFDRHEKTSRTYCGKTWDQSWGWTQKIAPGNLCPECEREALSLHTMGTDSCD